MEQTARAKPSAGVPPHVTVLFPFVPAAALDDELALDLRALFGAFPPVAVTFSRFARFPEVLYLEPEPAEPFVAMTAAVVARYPEHPPYEGAFDAVVPHLTVAEGDALDAAESDVRPRLPITTHADEVVLLEEVEPDFVRWVVHARFRLGRR